MENETQSEQEQKYRPLMHVVLYQPEIPPNTGAIGRTCVALGFKLWLVRPLGFQLTAKALRRAGMDYWQHLEWEVVDHWDHLIERLPGRRFWMFTKFAEQSYAKVEYLEEDVLVFGRETSGLPDALVQDKNQCLRIPMRPEARSLNLSCSVSIAGYEASRQLEFNGLSFQNTDRS